MIITLVRHAEVLEEYQGRYNGHIDVTLSQNGKRQAKELAKKLKDQQFDKIYCSDLLRARETLAAFSYDSSVIFSDQLREKSWGRHEGKSFEEIEDEGIKYENFTQWINALDGESVESYVLRIKEYFYHIVFKQNATNVLIVTHSGVIKTLLSLTQNVSLEEAFSLELPYSSYVTLDINSLRYNCVS